MSDSRNHTILRQPMGSPAPSEERSNDVPREQAYLQLARRIKKLARPVCGLWPIRSDTSFPNISLDLAKALASLGDATGIVVPQRDWQDGSVESKPFIKVLTDEIQSITPIFSCSGASLPLERALAAIRGRYSQVLLDLSGLDIVSVTEVAHLPEVGIVLLVGSGSTNEFTLAKLRRRLPPDRLLGAVLVDP
jgi:hypothetical protein